MPQLARLMLSGLPKRPEPPVEAAPSMRAVSSRVVHLDNGSVVLGLDGPIPVVQALEAYFDPWFQRSEREPTVTVRMKFHHPTDSSLDSGPPKGWSRLERLRSENANHTWYVYRSHSSTGCPTFFIPENRSFISPKPSERAVEIVSPHESGLVWDAKEVVQRQVVQPLMLETHVMLHAAGVLIGNHGVAIAGHKGSGKSTLQLHLAAGGAGLISADRLFVCVDGTGALFARGYPARMSLHRDNFSRFPQLGDPEVLPGDGLSKVLLHPADAAQRLKTQFAGGAELGAILLLRRGDRRAPLLRRLRPYEIRDAIAAHQMAPPDPIVRDWLGLFSANRAPALGLWPSAVERMSCSVQGVEVASDQLTDFPPRDAVRWLESVFEWRD